MLRGIYKIVREIVLFLKEMGNEFYSAVSDPKCMSRSVKPEVRREKPSSLVKTLCKDVIKVVPGGDGYFLPTDPFRSP